jgi:predicted RecA/RadA family phage recombinase
MAKNHIRPGKTMPYTAGSDITMGTVIEFADMIGVALADIANGATGELAITEVWELAKDDNLAISQGDQLYWDTVNDEVDKTNTNVPCGKAYAAALQAATTVKVLLNV